MKTVIYSLLFFGSLFFLFFKIGNEPKKDTIPPEQKKAQEAAKELKNKMYDSYVDGVILLKKKMKDPSSFEVESAYALPNMTVCYKYRAKNSFGALDVGYAIITNDTVFVREKMQPKAFEKKLQEECENPLAVKMK
jgi:hypothetical protein